MKVCAYKCFEQKQREAPEGIFFEMLRFQGTGKLEFGYENVLKRSPG